MDKTKEENITAGRKTKYGEETVYVPFRVPKSKKETIKNLVYNKLRTYEKREEGSRDSLKK